MMTSRLRCQRWKRIRFGEYRSSMASGVWSGCFLKPMSRSAAARRRKLRNLFVRSPSLLDRGFSYGENVAGAPFSERLDDALAVAHEDPPEQQTSLQGA